MKLTLKYGGLLDKVCKWRIESLGNIYSSDHYCAIFSKPSLTSSNFYWVILFLKIYSSKPAWVSTDILGEVRDTATVKFGLTNILRHNQAATNNRMCTSWYISASAFDQKAHHSSRVFRQFVFLSTTNIKPLYVIVWMIEGAVYR